MARSATASGKGKKTTSSKKAKKPTKEAKWFEQKVGSIGIGIQSPDQSDDEMMKTYWQEQARKKGGFFALA
jgi:hypothetical protein